MYLKFEILVCPLIPNILKFKGMKAARSVITTETINFDSSKHYSLTIDKAVSNWLSALPGLHTRFELTNYSAVTRVKYENHFILTSSRNLVTSYTPLWMTRIASSRELRLFSSSRVNSFISSLMFFYFLW